MNKKWGILVGCAIVTATVLGATFAWLKQKHSAASAPVQRLSYQTDVGEQRTVTLADGSTIDLNSDTWMHVAFDNDAREIALTRGEAYFNVATEARPFKVAAGTAVVTALGSSFAMQVGADEMVVSVERGQVEVSAQNDPAQHREVKAQRQLTVTNHLLGKVQARPQGVAGWRDGWLEFEDESLGHVVAELDKYYRGNLRLEGNQISQLRVSARFRIAEIEKAIKILAMSMKLDMSMSETRDITLFQRVE